MDFWEPYERCHLADGKPELVLKWREYVVSMECRRLRDRFELSPDKGVGILDNIVRSDRVDREAVCRSRLEALRVGCLLGWGPRRVRPVPGIFDYAKQDCV